MLVEPLQDGAAADAVRVAPPCPLADGFHMIAWPALDSGPLLPAWDYLARTASTPNPFFEAWSLLPSLRALDPHGTVHLALAVAGGELVGLAPLHRDPDYHGRPLAHAATWIHPNFFCGAPLLAPGTEDVFWRGLLAHCDRAPGATWFAHVPLLPAESAAAAALERVCRAERRTLRVVCRERRALLRHGPTPAAHLVDAMSAKKRKELRRQRTRLEEEGTLTVERLRDAREIDAWADEFLALERRSWKGAQGSALASAPETAALFRASLSGAAAHARLERLALRLDGRAIAMLVTFLAAPGAFSYKTAFDEDFARFSPGMLLQLENLALLDDAAIAWCDSCAAEDHPMIERIWRDRREMAWISVEAGRGLRRVLGRWMIRIEAKRMELRA